MTRGGGEEGVEPGSPGGLEEVVERSLERLQAGEAVDSAALAAAHPEIAAELKRRLSTLDVLVRAARREDDMEDGIGERGLRCPHCGGAVALPSPAPPTVTCLNCGSSFGVQPAPGPDGAPAELPERIGRFYVVALLGRGAFGCVYQAHDAELDRMVAVKVPRAGLFDSADEEDRFLREARHAAQLRHQGIVQVHEIGRERGLPYIVSDYIESDTLAEVIAADRPSFQDAAALVAQIAEALAYAHDRRVIHRDVKPQNILIDGAGNPHVSDFGLARREDEVTVTVDGEILGTPAYMSPEQAAGDHARVSARSDVYSLGVVLFELLTGERPFRGSRSMLIHQLLHDEPRTPRSLNDHVPRDLDTICVKAMAKEPARRYATAREFAADLRRFLEGEPILARPVGRVEKLWRWTRRNSLLAASTAGLFFFLAAGLAVSLVLLGRLSRETRDKGEALAAVKGERDQKAAVLEEREKALSRAESLRLTALSSSLLASDPGQALLLAVEGARREENLASRNAILDTLLEIRERRTLRGHGGEVLRAVFSPDGTQVATASADGTARLWDAASGKVAALLQGHTTTVETARFSGEGRTLVTCGGDDSIRLWEPASGRALAAIWVREPIRSAELSPDGRRLLVVTGSGAAIWDVGTRLRAFALKSDAGGVTCAALSRDGRRIATGASGGRLQLLDAENGKRIISWHGHAGEVRWVRFLAEEGRLATFGIDGRFLVWETASTAPAVTVEGPPGLGAALLGPDGRRVAGFPAGEGAAVVWDLAAGVQVCALERHAGPVSCAGWSADGRRLAAVPARQERTARVWDAAGGAEIAVLSGHKLAITSIDLNPGGTEAVTSSRDRTARIWRVQGGAGTVVLRGQSDPVRGAAFSPDSRRVATAGADGMARLWEAATGEPLFPLPSAATVLAVDFSHDGTRLLTAEGARGSREAGAPAPPGAARIWDAGTGARLAALEGHSGAVVGAAWSADDRRVLTASADGTARLWDAAGAREIRKFQGDGSPVLAALLSADGRRVVTRTASGPVTLWDANSGAPITTLGRVLDPVAESVAFSADGLQVITASRDRTARLWEAVYGRSIAVLRGHAAALRSAAFSPDGRRVLTASVDRTARLWESPPDGLSFPLQGHLGEVNAAAFSPDGRRVATASADGTARLWSAATHEELATYRGHEGDIASLTFSPDGRRLLTLPAQGAPRIWPVEVLQVALQERPGLLAPDELRLYEIGTAEEREAYRQESELDALRELSKLLERRARTAAGLTPAPGGTLSAIPIFVESLGEDVGPRRLAAAIDLVEWWVKSAERREPFAFAAMASLKSLAGDRAAAILALEEAVRIPGASPTLRMKLAAERARAAPDLATYGSIDAALEEPGWATLIPEGARWRFFIGQSEPSPALEWTERDFDDDAWESGQSGFGYGDDGVATILESMRGTYTTLYVRGRFQLPDTGTYRRLLLLTVADDAFVAYLNGTEVGRARAGKPRTRVAFDARADYWSWEGHYEEVWIEPGLMRAGENVLAIQGLNESKDGADFSLVPSLLGEHVPDLEEERRRLAEFSRLAHREGAFGRLAYLEGRLLERSGRYREAAARLGEAARLERSRPEPALALARCLRAAGDARGATERLREALAAGLSPDDALWDLWFTLHVVDLEDSPAEVLAAMPPSPAGGGKSEAGRRGADIRWVLEEMAARGALRIRCGGEEYRSVRGDIWSRDRCYTAGYRYFGDLRQGGALEPFTEEIAGTDDDPLYQTERWFKQEEAVPAHYRLPLPPGRYRLTLHFAEIFLRTPHERSFDVAAEGTVLLRDYEPDAVGFATADRQSFELDVTDGFLDLLFIARLDLAKVSALEVEKLGTP